MELRSPDPTANPYLAFTLIIYAALYGINNRLELPLPANINLYKADSQTLKQYEKLPASLQEACKRASESDFIREHIPEKILNIYCGK